eukprot:gene8462-10056_t
MTVYAGHLAAKWTTLSFLSASPILGELAKFVNNPPVPATVCLSSEVSSSPQLHSGDGAQSTEDPADEFQSILSLTPEQIDSIARAFGQVLPGLLKEAINMLTAQPVRDPESLNTKFMLSKSNFTYSYSDLATFFGGLVKILGNPNVVPSLEENMRREHVVCTDSNVEFTTGNYNITTTPKLEWEFVVSPLPGWQYPCETLQAQQHARQAQHARQVIPLDTFLKVMETINIQLAAVGHTILLREEVIALRLYTGPMFAKYNPLLRQVLSGKEYTGNRYVNTIIAINSGILKLSKIQKAVK